MGPSPDQTGRRVGTVLDLIRGERKFGWCDDEGGAASTTNTGLIYRVRGGDLQIAACHGHYLDR